MNQTKSAINSIVLIALLMIGCVASSIAQEKMPEALFIKLSSGDNVAKYFQASSNLKQASLYRQEMAKAAVATRNDFSENFSLMPVFYFYDRDMDKVIAGKFEGVLMDSTLVPAAAETLPHTTNFLIAYFGPTPPFKEVKERHNDSSQIAEDINHVAKMGLVLLDSGGKLKSWPFPYFIPRFPAALHLSSKSDKCTGCAQSFSSKLFNIDYVICAETLQRKLARYYRFEKVSLAEGGWNE